LEIWFGLGHDGSVRPRLFTIGWAKLKEFKWRVPVPPKERLQEPGDESVLYQSAAGKSCMLLYRRSHVFVKLNSNTKENATRFARHIDELLLLNRE
jgi:hypothetical protein